MHRERIILVLPYIFIYNNQSLISILKFFNKFIDKRI